MNDIYTENDHIPEKLSEKYEALKRNLSALGSAAVAFSGGVDSTFLLFAASEALKDKTIAITASSCLFPPREMDEAASFCRDLGIKHIMLREEPLKIEGFQANTPERCYICKKAVFSDIILSAAENGISFVVEGSNLDDEGDYRPGHRAIAELEVKSPLREEGFTKAEIRTMSKYLNLPTWDKPSFACLASRFPYGEEITRENLDMVCRAEQILFDMGFKQFRVRMHGNLARIELLPGQFSMFMQEDVREEIRKQFRNIGFSYVTLDIEGYRSGSLNEVL